MHITKEENYKRIITTDHTAIINQIDKSIKVYNWDFILSSLPSGSFLVGGYIRDLILGRLTSKIDIDIVVPSKSYSIGKKIADTFQGKFIILDKERDVVRIIFQHFSIDIASQISPSMKFDLSSRDFSINSIGFSLKEKLLLDPLNGINDISICLLRTNSQQNLIDDPLRILRCFRFVSELDFNIDPDLINFVKKYKNLLRHVANERINYEIQKIIRGEKAFESVRLIKEFRIFDYLQSNKDLMSSSFNNDNFREFNKFERDKYFPLFFLNQIFDESSLRKLQFSKSEISNTKLLRKWKFKLENKPISNLDERERFELHKDLEPILPSLIIYLPKSLRIDWLKRWRDKNDKLFHPSNLVNGDIIKKLIKIEDGPLLGKLLKYLSMELAFERLSNFDEAIYKGKQWIEQNAPKCD